MVQGRYFVSVTAITLIINFSLISFCAASIPEGSMPGLEDNEARKSPLSNSSSSKTQKRSQETLEKKEDTPRVTQKKAQFTGLLDRDPGYDSGRELFYVGTPLSSFPKIDREHRLNSFCKDRGIGYFEAAIEVQQLSSTNENSSQQRLLMSTDKTNLILESAELMEIYHGLKVEGSDSRYIVPEPNMPPCSAVSSLELLFHETDTEGKNFSATYYGSGVLIEYRFILTAAHNIYDSMTGHFSRKITAYPGLKKGKKYWEASTTTYYINPSYFKDSSPQHDIALVDFEDSFKGKEEYGLFSFGFGYRKAEDLLGKDLQITGFPGGMIVDSKLQYLRCHTMATAKGKPKSISNGLITYDIDTTKGNSGSPIYFEDNEKYICCGVHSKGDKAEKVNKGAHINEKIFELISQWIKHK